MNVSFVYMIRCEDNSLYTGIAKDLERRLSEHFWQKKECAKYTKTHKMVKLEAAFTAQSWSEAARLEYAIKRLSKQQKERLVAEPDLVRELFAGRLEGCGFQPVELSLFPAFTSAKTISSRERSNLFTNSLLAR